LAAALGVRQFVAFPFACCTDILIPTFKGSLRSHDS
jgi:hypothetical protein